MKENFPIKLYLLINIVGDSRRETPVFTRLRH